MPTFINGPTNLPSKAPRNHSDITILVKWDLLSFISVDILLPKTFLVSIFCLVVINNSRDNSSS